MACNFLIKIYKDIILEYGRYFNISKNFNPLNIILVFLDIDFNNKNDKR